jgi:hypothetical protein
MVCPICITTFVMTNAPLILSTGAAMSGIAAIKMKQVPLRTHTKEHPAVSLNMSNVKRAPTFADRCKSASVMDENDDEQ